MSEATEKGEASLVMVSQRKKALCDLCAAVAGVMVIEVAGMLVSESILDAARDVLKTSGIAKNLADRLPALAAETALSATAGLAHTALVRLFQAGFLLALLLAILRRGPDSLGLKIANLKAIMTWSLAICFALGVLAAACQLFSTGIFGVDFFLQFVVGSPDRALTVPGYLVWTLLVVALLGPFVEEIFFRGVVFRCLRAWLPAFPAIILSAAIFALPHAGQGLLPLIQLVGGIAFAFVYEKTGNIFAPWVVHAAGNASMTLLHLLYV